jgi:hypothetical protein
MSEEAIKILEILQKRPDLVAPALMLVFEQAAIYGIPVEDDLPVLLSV